MEAQCPIDSFYLRRAPSSGSTMRASNGAGWSSRVATWLRWSARQREFHPRSELRYAAQGNSVLGTRLLTQFSQLTRV